MRHLAATILAVLFPRAPRPRPPADACQSWADGPWGLEVGARERELRNRGCADAGNDTWRMRRTACARRAHRLAAGGLTGQALTARVQAGGCRQDDDGSWQ